MRWPVLVSTVLAGAMLATAMLALAGCGFHPIYGSEGVTGSRVSPSLAAVEVGLIPGRDGQVLRLALQQRLEGPGGGGAKRYALQVRFAIAGEPIGFQTDTSVTRIRYVGSANYVLTATDPQLRTVTSGSARSLDGENVFQNQLFAADLESEGVRQRIAEAVADQITLQLAAYFDKLASAGH